MPGVQITGPTSTADWVLILPVALALMGAGALLMLRAYRNMQWLFALVVVLAIGWCDLTLLQRVWTGGPLSMTMGRWLPPFGISFTADIVSAVFALAAALVSLVVLVYLRMDMPDRARQDGVYPLILVLLAGVSGSFLTGDLFNLYVWFEVMLIASFGLMVIGGRKPQLDATIKYGFLNFLATTIFLIAVGLLYGTIGTLNMSDIIGRAPSANPATVATVAALLMLAFGMKAAAFPVNAWLPASYHTPPAALSGLMAGLLTKVGIYAMLRALLMLLPASRGALEPVLTAAAVLTLVLGPLGAIAETNLRRALGFILIGGVGAVIAGLAVPNAQGVAGAAMYILHAMLTMTALYLVAGLIEKMTGEADTRRMGGLYAATSLTSVLFFVLTLAVAGVPPFLGFWPKLLLIEGGIADGGVAGTGAGLDPLALAVWVAVLLNALLTLIAGARIWGHIFWRTGREGPLSETVAATFRPLTPAGGWLGLGAATALCAIVVVLGLFPGPLLDFGRAAADGLLHPDAYVRATGLAEATP